MAEPRSEIFEAVQADDLPRIRRLIAATPRLAKATDEEGLSIILFARYRSRSDALGIILDAQPELDIFEAAALGEERRAAEVLSARPDVVHAYSADGFTPLQLAAFFAQPNLVRLLLEQGADVNATSRNAQHLLALHSGAAGSDYEVCRLLVEHGATVNAAQEGGWRPLHAAAQQGKGELVELLLNAGADRSLANDDGQTPVETAAAAGHGDIEAMLKARPYR